jgi:soluble lytic murein transglycosylase-like protein
MRVRTIVFAKLLVVPVFVCLFTSFAQGQSVSNSNTERINLLIEQVHSRVNDAAEAATSVLNADRHRQRSERLMAAGEVEEARGELRAAAEMLAGDDKPPVQSDLFVQAYVSTLRRASSALESRADQPPDNASLRHVEMPPALSLIESILRANSVPPDLLAVMMVESAGDAMALSRKGARGMWQLMPDTARRYGLRVDDRVDERVDPIKSTHAASSYLRDLYAMFHDWPLALAAYNTGENRIQNVIDRTGIQRFTEMAQRRLLPLETIQYVPAVLRLMRSGPRS